MGQRGRAEWPKTFILLYDFQLYGAAAAATTASRAAFFFSLYEWMERSEPQSDSCQERCLGKASAATLPRGIIGQSFATRIPRGVRTWEFRDELSEDTGGLRTQEGLGLRELACHRALPLCLLI